MGILLKWPGAWVYVDPRLIDHSIPLRIPLPGLFWFITDEFVSEVWDAVRTRMKVSAGRGLFLRAAASFTLS